MAVRLGLGPVFAFEWLMTSRRWQGYAMRSLTVLLLLGAMILGWSEAETAFSGEASIQHQAELGQMFYGITATLLLGLVGLAAPAATAGSLCLDKARGNLTLLFATDLSNAEIVLGKLAARLVPVLGMILCASPVLAISTLFGGIDPVTLTGTILVILSCAVFGCSLAMTLSVWGKKTHEVLMATYVLGILYLLAAPLLAAFRTMTPAGRWPLWLPTFEEVIRYNPVYLVLAALDTPPGMAPITLASQATFFGLGLIASALLILLSSWRIRSVVVRQLGEGARSTRSRSRSRPSKQSRPVEEIPAPNPYFPTLIPAFRRARQLWPAPSLDRNPVLWRECQRKRMSFWNLAVWGVYVVLCGGFSLYSIYLMMDDPASRWRTGQQIGVMVNAMQVAVGLLMLSVSSATSLSEERQRGSLDVLLTTPLPTRSIVWGKWWGSFRSVPPLLILPMAVCLAQATFHGRYWALPVLAALILAYGAAITSLGLALATWIPRQGRAVGLSVGIYAFLCIAWIPIAFILFGDGLGSLGPGVASASPIMGVGIFSEMITTDPQWSSNLVGQTLWVLFWTVANLGVAAALLLASFATFNRCLGRIDEPVLFDEEDFLPAGMPAAQSPKPAPADLLGSDA